MTVTLEGLVPPATACTECGGTGVTEYCLFGTTHERRCDADCDGGLVR